MSVYHWRFFATGSHESQCKNPLADILQQNHQQLDFKFQDTSHFPISLCLLEGDSAMVFMPFFRFSKRCVFISFESMAIFLIPFTHHIATSMPKRGKPPKRGAAVIIWIFPGQSWSFFRHLAFGVIPYDYATGPTRAIHPR